MSRRGVGEFDETWMKLHFCTFLFFLSSLPLRLLLLLLLLLDLFQSAVVSVLVYGNEVWQMDDALCRKLKGWYSYPDH